MDMVLLKCFLTQDSSPTKILIVECYADVIRNFLCRPVSGLA